jgi:hypothetical protein
MVWNTAMATFFSAEPEWEVDGAACLLHHKAG